MSVQLGPNRAGSSSYSLRPAFEAHGRVRLAIALYNGLVCFSSTTLESSARPDWTFLYLFHRLCLSHTATSFHLTDVIALWHLILSALAVTAVLHLLHVEMTTPKRSTRTLGAMRDLEVCGTIPAVFRMPRYEHWGEYVHGEFCIVS